MSYPHYSAVLNALDEGNIQGIVMALGIEDPMRYAEEPELVHRVKEILEKQEWDETRIRYWFEWFNWLHHIE